MKTHTALVAITPKPSKCVVYLHATGECFEDPRITSVVVAGDHAKENIIQFLTQEELSEIKRQWKEDLDALAAS